MTENYFVVMNSSGHFFNGYKFVREFPSAKLFKKEKEAITIAKVCSKLGNVEVHRNYGRGDEGIVWVSK